MKILVIGGTKFIGAYTVRRLSELGHEVAVFHRGETNNSILPAVEHIHGNRKDLSSYARRFSGFKPDAILDMMALTQRDAEDLAETIRGICPRVIVASSGDVYRAFGIIHGRDQGIQELPLREDSELRESRYPNREEQLKAEDDPASWRDYYEKIHVEEVLLGDPELETTVLRLPAVYGPGDHRPYPYLKRMDDGRTTLLLGDGLAQWRFARGFVENVADAIALAVTSERASGEIFNVGDQQSLTEHEWVQAIAEAAGWKGEILIVPQADLSEEGGNPKQNLTYDTSRIRAELGFKERIDLVEGLKKTIAWEREHPPKKTDESQFDYNKEDRLIARAKR